jgi:hypothetical protein
MKRIIAAVAIVAALTLTMAPAAQAVPRYGHRHNSANGWIVWSEETPPGAAVAARGTRATGPGT